MFRKAKGFFSNDLSIDLGKPNKVSYVSEKSMVLTKPSVVLHQGFEQKSVPKSPSNSSLKPFFQPLQPKRDLSASENLQLNNESVTAIHIFAINGPL